MAEIAGEREAAPALVFLMLFLKQAPSAVMGSVIHANELAIRLPEPGGPVKPLEKNGQNRLFIKAGHDDGYFLGHGFRLRFVSMLPGSRKEKPVKSRELQESNSQHF
jgi:hypothetical protein